MRLVLMATMAATAATATLAIAPTPSRAADPSPSLNSPTKGAALPITCGEGLEAITSDACFAPPAHDSGRPAPGPAPLLLYLHGLYQPEAMREELDRQTRVAKRASARGYAVLALRGPLGACDTRGDHRGWFCWPSNEQVSGHGAEVVASWKEPLARARARVGHGKTFVLGFSNGAYFAALMAVRDLFPASAYVIAQGGPVEPVHALGNRAPILLLSTNEEAPIVHAEMDRFGSELASDGWSFVQEERTGGHELNEQDVAAALDFFDEPSHDALH